MLLPVVALVLLKMLSAASAGEEDSLDDRELEFYKRLYDFGLGKRAPYTYLSEYKRLPVYNFGLGKRNKPYGFGLGKRDYYDEDSAMEVEGSSEYGKRMQPYGFGLGKRSGSARQQPKAYNFGLGKRPEGKLYSFGLGKRSFSQYDEAEDESSSEEEKRTGGGHRFSFGLGKRGVTAPAEGRPNSMHYNGSPVLPPQQHPTR